MSCYFLFLTFLYFYFILARRSFAPAPAVLDAVCCSQCASGVDELTSNRSFALSFFRYSPIARVLRAHRSTMTFCDGMPSFLGRWQLWTGIEVARRLHRFPIRQSHFSPSLVPSLSRLLSHRSPDGTPFADGVFKLTMTFSEDYPNRAPRVKFVSRIFHPNGTFVLVVCFLFTSTS